MRQNYVVSIDLGAGSGAKLAVFDNDRQVRKTAELSKDEFEPTFESLYEQLVIKIKALCHRMNVVSIGFATNGILKSDKTYILAANSDYMNGKNLASAIEQQFNLPVGMMNDADTGGLAEWSIVQAELLYWVLGGGFGGAWLSEDGKVMFPAMDWDRNDESLHFTNEPGYAVPLEKKRLMRTFDRYGFDFGKLEARLSSLLRAEVKGPCNDKESIRTEMLVSGNGLPLIFYSSKDYTTELDLRREEEKIKLVSNEKNIDGKVVYELACSGNTIALMTFALFGEIFADAAHVILTAAQADGANSRIPIYLAGKPLDSLPFYGPSLQQRLTTSGHFNYVRPSNLAERGINPNLLGAAVLAERMYREMR